MISSIPILQPADAFGPYQILENLGPVPYGTLFKALDTRSDELAMLKVIPPSLQGGWQEETPWEILLRETHDLSRIYHRGLSPLLEIGEHEGALLVAFAPVEGSSLHDLLGGGTRPDRAMLIDWGCELLEALAEAHAAGILHRHLGGEEVFVSPEGQILVTGFGLTQLVFDPFVPLPPEQLMDEPFTPQSDLYAVGALLRRLAFASGLKTGPAGGRDPLLKILARATSSDPAARFANALEMAEALRQAGRLLAQGRGRETAPDRGLLEEEAYSDRRYALLLLASSLLLLLLVVLAGWYLIGGEAVPIPEDGAFPASISSLSNP